MAIIIFTIQNPKKTGTGWGGGYLSVYFTPTIINFVISFSFVNCEEERRGNH
jgi:hypothetical protein